MEEEIMFKGKGLGKEFKIIWDMKVLLSGLWMLVGRGTSVDTERGVNQYQVQFQNLFQLILKPFNYIQ
jgi:hypothetical protein